MKSLLIWIFTVPYIYAATHEYCMEKLFPDFPLRYKYSSEVATSIPALSTDRSSLKLRSDLYIQKIDEEEFILQLKNLTMAAKLIEENSERSDYDPSETSMHEDVQYQMETLLELPFRIQFSDHHLLRVFPAESDVLWSSKIKEGIAQLFRTNCQENYNERTSHGERIVSTSFDKENNIIHKNFYLDKAKARDDGNTVWISDATIALLKFDDKHVIVKEAEMSETVDHYSEANSDTKSTSFVTQKISYYGEEELIQMPQNVFTTLDQIREKDEVWLLEKGKKFSENILPLLREIANATDLRTVFEKMQDLQHYVRYLRPQHILQCLRNVKDDLKEQKVLLASLSDHAEKLIVILERVIEEKLLPEGDLLDLLKTISLIKPEKESSVKKLIHVTHIDSISENVRHQLFLTIGAVLYPLRNGRISKDVKESFMEHMFNKLQQSIPRSKCRHRILKAIETAGFGSEDIKQILKKFINDDKESLEDKIRSVAAMRKWKSDRDFVRDLLEPLYWKENSATPLKIACFETIIESESGSLLNLISRVAVGKEKDSEMKRYIYKYLQTLKALPIQSPKSILGKLQREAYGIIHRILSENTHRLSMQEIIKTITTVPRSIFQALMERHSLKRLLEKANPDIDGNLENLKHSFELYQLPKVLAQLKRFSTKHHFSFKKIHEEVSKVLHIAVDIMGDEINKIESEKLSEWLFHILEKISKPEFSNFFLLEHRRSVNTLSGFEIIVRSSTNLILHKTHSYNGTEHSYQCFSNIRALMRSILKMELRIPFVRNGVISKREGELNLPVNLRIDPTNQVLEFESNRPTTLWRFETMPILYRNLRNIHENSYIRMKSVQTMKPLHPVEFNEIKVTKDILEDVVGKNVIQVENKFPVNIHAFRSPDMPWSPQNSLLIQLFEPVKLTLKNASPHRVDVTVSSDEKSADYRGSFHFENEKAIVRLERLIPHSSPICVSFETFQNFGDVLKIRTQAHWGQPSCNLSKSYQEFGFQFDDEINSGIVGKVMASLEKISHKIAPKLADFLSNIRKKMEFHFQAQPVELDSFIDISPLRSQTEIHSLCSIEPNYQLTTFDGLKYQVPTKMGCGQTLVMCTDRLVPFTIQTATINEQQALGLIVRLPNAIYQVFPYQEKRGYWIKVNGDEVETPYNDDAISISRDQGRMSILLRLSRTQITFEKDVKTIKLSHVLYKSNEVKGLCGNFDGNKSNDQLLPNGVPSLDTKDFVKAYTKHCHLH